MRAVERPQARLLYEILAAIRTAGQSEREFTQSRQHIDDHVPNVAGHQGLQWLAETTTRRSVLFSIGVLRGPRIISPAAPLLKGKAD